MSDTTLFFVMDGPDFEPGAILLAASLRRHMGAAIAIEACVPEPRADSVSDLARDVLGAMNVTIRHFDNRADWATPYPHGNKILAACQPRDTAAAVFFDTDMVCTAPLDLAGLGTAHTLMAVPEGVATWSRNDADWAPLYAEFGLGLPDTRVQLTRGRRITMLPYFNAGLVGYSQAPGPDGRTLPEIWLETALVLDRMEYDRKRPWLDQVALPIAAARMGARLDVRDGSYNFSLHRREANPELERHILHYHLPRQYRDWPQCRAVTDEALARCPDGLRAALTARLRAFIGERARKSA